MWRLSRSVGAAAGVALAVLLHSAVAVAQGQPDLPEEWAKVRRELEKYQDVIVALRDGYRSSVLCVQNDQGHGMGIHFVNTRLMGPTPDATRPQILLYVPVGSKLELIGAEWFIPLATGVKGRPSVLGQPFDGPMEGHPPTQPPDLHHYDLHVWLFKPNPAGLFAQFNPNVKCPADGYTETAHPAKLVPHP